jgi:hypothetical protein
MNPPKRKFGGKQAGAGRKSLPPEQRQYPVTIFVDYDTLRFLQSLPRTEAVELKRKASAVLRESRIKDQIIGG